MEYEQLTYETFREGVEECEEFDFFILTMIGRSSKVIITQDDGTLVLVNEIDDTSVEYDSFDTLLEAEENISRALTNGVLYAYVAE